MLDFVSWPRKRAKPGWSKECTEAVTRAKQAERKFHEKATLRTWIDFAKARNQKKNTILTNGVSGTSGKSSVNRVDLEASQMGSEASRRSNRNTINPYAHMGYYNSYGQCVKSGATS
jgi:hypothetical protein